MRIPTALVGVVFLVGNAQAADDLAKNPPNTEELQRLQGTWQAEAWEENGKALDEADVKKRLIFFGANMFVLRRDGKPLRAGALQLAPGNTPPAFDVSIEEGDCKGDVLHGIYALDGDTLKLCFDPKGYARPKSFQTDDRTGFTFVQLKRLKPPVAEKIDIVGKYRSELVEATTGKTTFMDVTIEKRGDAYVVTHRLGEKVLFVGTAIRKGEQLSMGWMSGNQMGVTVYTIEAGPKLTGEYTVHGGIGVTAREVLTPVKKKD